MSDHFEDYRINKPDYLDGLADFQNRPLRPGMDYVPTILPTWSRFCGDEGGAEGMAMGWHVIIAGNPGHGKSLFAINLGAQATTQGVAVGYVSLEMSHKQLAIRNLAIRTGADIRKLERGRHFDYDETNVAIEKIQEHEDDAPFQVNDQRFYDVAEILGLMNWWRSLGVSLFIIDYMQLLGSPGVTGPEEVAHVSRSVSNFAKEHRVLTVGLSQFNRETSKNYHDSPTIQGLHGGAAMENEADQIVMLDHSRYEVEKGKGAMTWAIVGKNRHGDKGSIPVWLSYRNLQIREAMADEVGNWPGNQRDL